MLQRILGSHPDVHTLSEPWLLLHPLYALRDEGIWTDYNASTAWKARQDFIQSLPQGEDDYFRGLRRMYGYLYARALAGSGKSRFLDKTPRYYQIIPELKRLFPKAQFIVLLRNPLAVLCSLLRTWVRGSWFLLGRYKHDLLNAPGHLVRGIKELGDSCLVVHYEELVNEPEIETRRICAGLGLDFLPGIVEYGRSNTPPWQHGDQVGVRQHMRPDPSGAEKWARDLESPQAWRLARDYLSILGQDTVSEMGYPYDELLHTLLTRQPASIRLVFTWPLRLLVNGLSWSEHGQVVEQRADKLLSSLHRDGLATTCQKIARELRKGQE